MLQNYPYFIWADNTTIMEGNKGELNIWQMLRWDSNMVNWEGIWANKERTGCESSRILGNNLLLTALKLKGVRNNLVCIKR